MVIYEKRLRCMFGCDVMCERKTVYSVFVGVRCNEYDVCQGGV
jgi:hypothetical protein